MASVFSRPKAPTPDPSIKEAQDKQEERLASQEREQKEQIAARKRVRRTGGLRLLMSPEREGGATGQSTKLGGGK